jgi:hypothetical protein
MFNHPVWLKMYTISSTLGVEKGLHVYDYQRQATATRSEHLQSSIFAIERINNVSLRVDFLLGISTPDGMSLKRDVHHRVTPRWFSLIEHVIGKFSSRYASRKRNPT